MKRFKNILCVVEQGTTSEPALKRAVTLAEDNQAALTLVSVVPRMTAGIGLPDGGPLSLDLQAALVKERTGQISALTQKYQSRVAIQTKVLTGTAFLEIIREVLRNGYDLVIKVPEDPKWLGRLFGGDDMHLLRKCPCPVWLIKAQAPKAFKRVLAAVDVDDVYPEPELLERQALNRQILEMASSLALADFAELHVVHIWSAIAEKLFNTVFTDTPEEKIALYVEQERRRHAHWLETLMRDVRDDLGQEAYDYLKPQSHLLKGSPRREIPALARQLDVDCIVMGTVGRTGIPGLIMGNTAETILEQIGCSVLAVKPEGFATPVEL